MGIASFNVDQVLRVVASVNHAHENGYWVLAFVLGGLVIAATIGLTPKLRSLATGRDGRTSTSKVQVLLWTYAVLFVLWTLFFAWLIATLGADSDDLLALKNGFQSFLHDGLDEDYLFLLGFPLGAAVGAKAITTSKVASGTAPKTEASPNTATPSQVVQDDQGNTDLGDYQYLLFTLLAIAYFLMQFALNPSRGLPDMPATLVALTSLSAAAYVAKKGLYTDPPVLLSVNPPQAPPGDPVTLYGSQLSTPAPPAGNNDRAQSSTATVLFGTTPGAVSEVDEDGKSLKVEVPRRLKPGPTTIAVTRPPGATSEAIPFEVLDDAPIITAVHNSVIAFGTDEQLTIEGEGFLAGGSANARNAVVIGGRRLDDGDSNWTDTRVTVKLPTTPTDIAALELRNGTELLTLYDAKGRPSATQPVTLAGIPDRST